jgi:hypothetical protein
MALALLLVLLQAASDPAASDSAEFCRQLTGIGEIELAAGGIDCELRSDGELTCFDGEGVRFRTTVEMEPDDCVERAYLRALDPDLLLVYEYTGGGYGGSAALRVTSAGAVSWRQRVAGFNLAEPLLDGTSAYLATIDFVGRLDTSDGAWIWRKESLEERIGSLVSPGALRREADRLVATSSGPYQKSCELAFAVADGEWLSADCE